MPAFIKLSDGFVQLEKIQISSLAEDGLVEGIIVDREAIKMPTDHDRKLITYHMLRNSIPNPTPEKLREYLDEHTKPQQAAAAQG